VREQRALTFSGAHLFGCGGGPTRIKGLGPDRSLEISRILPVFPTGVSSRRGRRTDSPARALTLGVVATIHNEKKWLDLELGVNVKPGFMERPGLHASE